MADRGRGYDVAVLGAAAAGAAIAYALARRRIIPAVIDAGSSYLPAPASPVASVLRGNTPDVRLALRSAERLPELQDAVGPFGYRRTGGLWAALSAAEAEAGEARARAAREAGLAVAWLTPEEALRREPAINPSAAGAVYCTQDGVADPAALSRRLVFAAERFGAAVHVDCGYVQVARQNGDFRITAGRDDVIARRLVVASAPLLRALGRSLGAELPLRVVRRRLCITGGEAPVLRHVVNGIRQEPSGAFVLDPVLAVEEAGLEADAAAEVALLRRIVSAAVRVVPAVEASTILHAPRWTFVEPADGRPAVGRLDDDVYLAIAAEDQAVILAPLIGETIADAVAKHRWSAGLEIWAPDRFGAAAAPAGAARVQDSPEGS